MRSSLIPLALAAYALCPIPVDAQAPSAALGSCLTLLRGYASWRPEEERSAPWELTASTAGGGSIRVFGAVHSSNPVDSQFARIDSAWALMTPTVAFYEGPARPIAETREGTIREFGESGYVRFLATKHGARIARLEPPPQAELDTLLAVFPAEQVKLFYILREAARFRDMGSKREAVDRAVTDLLVRAAERLRGFDGLFSDLDQLDAAYRRHFTAPADWHDVPQRWFNPIEDGRETGGKFTNAANRLSSEFRNLHMAAVLVAEARAGARVFAVVGRNHVPMFAPAVRCAVDKRP